MSLLKKIFDTAYFVRLIFLQIVSILFLYDTTSLNIGIISIESFIYSINYYLFTFFIILETISSVLDLYGLNFKFVTIFFKNIDGLNIGIITSILFQIKRYLFFLILLIIINFLIKKYKKIILGYINKNNLIKLICVSIILILFLSLNNIQNNYLKFIKINIHNYDLFLANKKIFRNDNWFLKVVDIFYYKDQNVKNSNLIINFDKILLNKEYRNYYIIISESYPNFRSKKLEDLLFNQIIKNNKDLLYKKYQKKWDKNFTTLGAETELYCGKKIDVNNFIKTDLKKFFNNNNCIINKFKNKKELIFIHSYLAKFNNRKRYQKFFDQTYFYKELNDKDILECAWNDFGKCDFDVINKLNNIIKKKNRDVFTVFLTLNNHLGIINKTTNKTFINCSETYPLYLNNDFCILFNNQFFFNNKLNEFLKKINKEDIVIMFGDTPPLFSKKDRTHFKDLVNVYVFNKR